MGVHAGAARHAPKREPQGLSGRAAFAIASIVLAGLSLWLTAAANAPGVARVTGVRPIIPAYVALSAPSVTILPPPAIRWSRFPVVPAIVITEAVAVAVPGAPDPAAMTAAEQRYGLTPGILYAIAVVESSDGQQACGFNAWGWESCAVTFGSWQDGIDTVAQALSAAPYAGLPVRTQLCIYESGRPCTTAAGAAYADRAMALLP